MRWMMARPAYLQEEHHFYPTPPACVTALLACETFPGPIWEPACGDGAISKVLACAGYDVVSTDLIDRGFGTGGVDFLGADRPLGRTILTNPPFKLAEAFAGKAIDLGVEKVALLCRVQWLQGIERRKLFTQTPLARVWILPYRPKFRAGQRAASMGGGMIAYAWFIWSHGHNGAPSLGWL